MSDAILKPGGGIKPELPFKPVRVAILTVSDTRDEATDTSGQILIERVQAAGHAFAGRAVVRDDIDKVRAQVRAWIASGDVDAIVTTGGTGLTGRDIGRGAGAAVRQEDRRLFGGVPPGVLRLGGALDPAIAGDGRADRRRSGLLSAGQQRRGEGRLGQGDRRSTRQPSQALQHGRADAEVPGVVSKLTHIDDQGRARMVDVSDKPATAREAVATGFVRMSPETLDLAVSGQGRKGDVRAVAELAGVMAAKQTSNLIPLCHPLALSKVAVEVAPTDGGSPSPPASRPRARPASRWRR
jgi:hypothetical protein